SWARGGAVAEEDLVNAADQLLDGNPEGAAVCRILLALARLERDHDNGDELEVAYVAAHALQDGYAVLHVLATQREAWERRYPGGRAALVDETDRWLAALEGDRQALGDLEARLASAS